MALNIAKVANWLGQVDKARAVVAIEGADEGVEVGGAIAGHVDRQADPRRPSGRYAGVVEGELRHVAEELAAETRGLVVDARVIAGSDRDRVVQDRAVRGTRADAAIHGAARLLVRGVRRSVEAQKLAAAVTRRGRPGVTEQDCCGEHGENAKRTRERCH